MKHPDAEPAPFRLRACGRPYWWICLPSGLLAVVETIGALLLPILTLVAADAARAGGRSALPVRICPSLGTGWGIVPTGAAVGILAADLLLVAVCAFGGAWLDALCSSRFGDRLRSDLYRHIQALPFSARAAYGADRLDSLLREDAASCQTFVHALLRTVLRAPLLLAGASLAAMWIHPLAGSLIPAAVLTSAAGTAVFLHAGRARRRAVRERRNAIRATAQENLDGVREVRAFGGEARERARFAGADRDLTSAETRTGRLALGLSLFLLLLVFASLGALTLFGGDAWNGGLSVSALTTLLAYAAEACLTLPMIVRLSAAVCRASDGRKRVLSLMRSAPLPPADPAGATLGQPDGSVEFQHVSVLSRKGHARLLDDVSFTAPAGSTVGIIGLTEEAGAALASLIARLDDPDEGEALIGGAPARTYPPERLREIVGTALPGDSVSAPFPGCLKDVLLCRRAAAAMVEKGPEEEEAIRRALSLAQLADEVRALTRELDDRGGLARPEQGALPPDRVGRLCLACALLRDPRILIWDDVAVAPDAAVHARLREALDTVCGGMTKIILARRIPSVMDADLILVMREGRVAGAGTHGELLASCAEYRALCEDAGIPAPIVVGSTPTDGTDDGARSAGRAGEVTDL